MLIIGIGNEFRQDDGVGIAAARAVRAAALPGVEVCERSGEGTDLITSWSHRPLVFVIDAVRSGAPAGTVHRFEIVSGPFPEKSDLVTFLPSTHVFRGTSHQIGLGEAVELGRVLDQLPSRLVVYGVEGSAFGEGVGLSAPVADAAAEVVARIRSECRR